MKLRLYLLLLAMPLAVLGAEPATGAAPSEILAFADILFKQGDYYRAITEYERFVFLSPHHPNVSRAQLQVGMCYLYGRKWDAAAEYFLSLKDHFIDQPVGEEAWIKLADTYYSMEQYSKTILCLEEFERHYPQSPHMDDARLLKGICYLRFGNPQWAREAFQALPVSSPKHDLASECSLRMAGYDDIPIKSPLVAGGLSAIIPGAGQLYTERPRDALVSFLINGITIAGIALAFADDEKAAGCFFGLLEIGWYSGNIYNAVNGAHKQNRQKVDDFLSPLEIRCGLLTDRQIKGTIPALGIGFRF